MEENPIILDYSHKKLDEVPREILDSGRMLEELYLDSNDIELIPKVAISYVCAFHCSRLCRRKMPCKLFT